jgi:hypothetical protein
MTTEVDGQPDRSLLQSGPGEHQAGVAAYNASLKHHPAKHHPAVCCSCSKSAAKSPALVAAFINPIDIDGSTLPDRSHTPVPPVLSGRDQASPNSLIESPLPAHRF